jgi:hypothetical protein
MPTRGQSTRKLIVERAVKLGYTPARLAANADISLAQMYRFFAGTSDLSSERVDRLLSVLGLTVLPESTIRRLKKRTRPDKPPDTSVGDGPDTTGGD